MGGLGGFGGLFDPKAAGFTDPILVSATDGVGTKLKIATDTGIHDTVGIDLVAMCVNDLVVQGAEPLFFLDYFATGKLDGATAASVVSGISKGCRLAGCALIGGETAEMPGMYGDEDYDLAGFSVGAAERGNLLPRGNIGPGDIVLGLPSSGLHSNGFSLVRQILANKGIEFASISPFMDGATWGEVLLTPTRIYVSSCLSLHETGLAKAFAHITGGGLTENIPRILPDGMGVHLEAASWPLPDIFGWLIESGEIPREEMIRTFNCGIGMVVVVAPEDVEPACKNLSDSGADALVIGEVIVAQGDEQVLIPSLANAWQP